MLRLTYSNRSEQLLARMAEDIQSLQRQRPLAPIQLVVPHRNVELWLRQHLAQHLGVAANLDIVQLKRFVRRLLDSASRQDAQLWLIDADVLLDQLLALFFEPGALDEDAALAPLAAYLDGPLDESAPLRRFQLAHALARLFDEYALSRDFLTRWQRGERAGFAAEGARQIEAWQAALWRLLRSRLDEQDARSGGRHLLPAQLPGLGALRLNQPTFFFGISHMALAYHRLLSHLDRASSDPLHVYALNPCAEFWEQMPAGFEVERGDQADPFGLNAEKGHPLLQAWGRPGRENIRVLDELTGCDFHDAFDLDAAPTTVLARLQRDILLNTPEPTSIDADAPPTTDINIDDGSVAILACASLQRECEAIAGEIARALRRDPSLRFGEVAVLVAHGDPTPHVAHLTSALAAFHIPVSVGDLPFEHSSRLAEAAQLLLDLPLGRFTRSEVLRVLTHPALRGHVKGLEHDTLPTLIDRLGIHYGLDRGDQGQSYLRRDLFNWDQGLARLALGQVMRARTLGDETPVQIERGDGVRRYWPEAPPLAFEGGVGQWALLVRSLLADARLAADGNQSERPQAWRTLGEWARFISAMFETYLFAESEADEAERDQLVRAAGSLEGHVLHERGTARALRIPYRVACELLRQKLAGMRGRIGHFLLDGVAIGALQPQRALPFRQVFVAGLDATEFPGISRRDPLDLRREELCPGPDRGLKRFDVFERERAQYLFLETLLCARDRLVLTFVGRDPITGEPLAPSPIVIDLERALARLAPGHDFRRALPDRRCDLALFPSLAALLRAEFMDVGDDFPSRPSAQREACALTFRALLERRNPEAMRAFLQSGQALDRATFEAIVAPLDEAERQAARRIADALALLPKTAVAPPSAPSAEPRESIVSLSMLRKFLEDPAQASAQALLRLEMLSDEESAAALSSRDDERFSFEDQKRDRAVFLRDQIAAFITEAGAAWADSAATLQRLAAIKAKFKNARAEDKRRQKAEAERAFEEATQEVEREISPWFERRTGSALDRLMGEGKFPTGLFGEAAAAALWERLARWSSAFLCLPWSGALSFRRVFFGEASEFEPIQDLRPPIDLGELDLPSGKVRLRLRGATDLIGFDAGDRPTAALCFATSEKSTHQLRGFIDVVACLASRVDSEEAQGFEVAVIADKESAVAERHDFLPISPEAAREFLRALAAEMLQSPNAYWMPGEEILAALKPRSRDTPLLDRLRKPERTSFGPLRSDEVEALPLPSGKVLQRAFFPEGSPAARWAFFADRRGAEIKANFFEGIEGLGNEVSRS
ncbi:MAG: exodeoxyribonuclease V subunit gamma [Myxococcales bacterium]|jgi:exodeoxyribonuclease V gamma subunit|nr:exodeoxyribonuclease V subunit gamma [Myxococcales bacterium]